MVDMAKSPEDVKKEIKDYALPTPASADKPSVPTYPYGLCLSLTEEELGKLGIAGDFPEVGEMIHLAAMAKVTSVSESEREGTDGAKTRCCRIELQITHLACENEDEEEAEAENTKARRGRFYAKVDGAPEREEAA
jgi:hypothetical protein